MTHRIAAVQLILCLTLGHASLGLGQERPVKTEAKVMDLIPENARFAIGIRDMSELIQRGDKLIAQADLKVGFRLSDGFGFLTSTLRVNAGLDPTGSFAFMSLGGKDFDLNALVLAIPMANKTEMAGNFGLQPEKLIDGVVMDRRKTDTDRRDSYANFFAVRDNHVFLGMTEAAVQLALKGNRMSEQLSAELNRTLQNDDILLYANRDFLRRTLQESFRGVETDWTTDLEAELIDQLSSTLDDLQTSVMGIRLKDGVGATLTLDFDGKDSKEFLSQFRTKTPTSLHGLPHGKVLLAHASSGNSETTSRIAQAAMSMSTAQLHTFGNSTFTMTDQANLFAVLGESWQRADGIAAAIYENQSPETEGAFSIASVLRTDAPQEFITSMTELIPYLNVQSSPESKSKLVDQQNVQRLIDGLGDRRYRVRQSSMIRLQLIADSVTEELKRATKSDDYEVRTRANSILRAMMRDAEIGKKALLSGDLLSKSRPQFAWAPKQESRQGIPIHHIQIQPGGGRKEMESQLRGTLGPQWNTIRLAAIHDNLIVFLGSNDDLLDELLTSVIRGENEIETNNLQTFRERTGGEVNAEFHLSLSRIAALIGNQPPPKHAGLEKPVSPSTSVGLSIEPQRIRLDVFAPYDQAKTVLKQAGL